MWRYLVEITRSENVNFAPVESLELLFSDKTDDLQVNPQEIKVYIGILLLTGYVNTKNLSGDEIPIEQVLCEDTVSDSAVFVFLRLQEST